MGIHLISGANSAPAEDRTVLDVDVEATATINIGVPLLYVGAEATVDADATVNAESDEPKLKIFIDPIDKSVHDYPDRPPPEDEDSPDKRSLFPRALTADQKEGLRLHTVARQKKNVKALVWDTKLEAAAKAWAQKIAKSGKLAHSASKDRPNQGENLAYGWSSGTYKNPITAGTQGWLAEVKNYKNEVIPKGKFSEYGHYTQCVWKNSVKIGIATASDGKGGWYTVARYSPPGNIVGQKPY
ncbi:uncharacterized protein NECHADRAFT_51924 [Fusarium vanettenii 77-13-4]|uniref:SCP domain-containing protein n=1 Tax=Fusarium vanettenii (strain ATCC MYA-4622 / CBS 123669 / FGSC 9596 / NRRL 45880 / 77-13-4) TaxID=660122 RepID=C7ZH39_FUSV7|nr:uncharacterized protein NECHADRAFT_51924 [Fusarium vanettenii 77-13-4]EEU36744.1 hypothetical protein NECHADRAFT_51924 [Fusarium vanettenii 77-13-4]